MKDRILLFLLFLLPLQLVHAQSKNDNQQKYLRAKNLFKQEQYVQAMDAFRQLAAVQNNNSFAEYASFYYALSALEAGRPAEARAMLQQIRRKYSGWDQQEEVSYLLTRVYLEEKSWVQAIETIREIRNKRVQADAREMAANFFAREQDLSMLKNLLQKYPEADYLAKVVANKISRQPLPEQDQEYLQQLVSTYKLDKELVNKPGLGTSQKKEAYHVAALLPFLYNDLQPESNLHTQNFVLDIYEGMKIAVEDLDSLGVKINLHAFDTKRDSLTTKKLINTREMEKMDLIVGPLYPGPSKVAFDFSYENGVNMVNPLSFNPEVIQNNPYSFLFRPSLVTQGKRAAEFASRSFEDKNAFIIYGPKEKDSIMAHSYKQAIEKNGFRVKRMEKIPAGEESRINKILLPGNDNRDAMKEGGSLHQKNVGHVFVASEDELIVSYTINALEKRGDRLPLVGHESWLKKNIVRFDQVERLGVYFVAPEFVDYTSEGYLEFRNKYRERVNNLPSRFAYAGYDLMMYFGQMMHQYGNLFQKEIDQEPFRKGILCTGYSFTNSNDNQCVPVVKFNESALEIVFQ